MGYEITLKSIFFAAASEALSVESCCRSFDGQTGGLEISW
jgi:hypothetical protein